MANTMYRASRSSLSGSEENVSSANHEFPMTLISVEHAVNTNLG
jgi:hypothetical protein